MVLAYMIHRDIYFEHGTFPLCNLSPNSGFMGSNFESKIGTNPELHD